MADVLFRTSSSHTSFFDRKDDCGPPLKKSFSFNNSASSSRTSSTDSTSTSSLSLQTSLDDLSSDDDILAFPSYGNSPSYRDEEESEAPPSSPIVSHASVSLVAPSPSDATTLVATPDPLPISEDDTAVRLEPSHHVDYLSHDWIEEDIWASWRHIVEHRRVYGERSRLENASWRTWAKQQFKLKTTSPESLNWLKDVDITWLYGPLQPAANRSSNPQTSTPSSRLSKSNSFLHKKPILKKRSMSEVMLQKSISASSLVKEAAAAVQAQQASGVSLERRRRPIIGRAASDFAPTTTPLPTISRTTTDFFFSSSQSTSGLQTPDPSEKKHIRFDEKVEQCIAVDVKGPDDEDDDFNNQNPWAKYSESSDSSDEGVVMMKKSRKKRPLSRTNSKTTIQTDSKTIAKLPSTTLKYRTDSPDITDQQQQHHSLGFWRSSRLSPSPSQETLRPANPAANFLLPDDAGDGDDDDDDAEMPGPENTFTFGAKKRSGTPTPESSASASGLRRTASGMFMPFDDDDDDDEAGDATPPGLIGKVVDTVNTARDIAHVIWNVGWRG